MRFHDFITIFRLFLYLDFASVYRNTLMLCSIEIILWISISNVEKDIFVSDVKSLAI